MKKRGIIIITIIFILFSALQAAADSYIIELKNIGEDSATFSLLPYDQISKISIGTEILYDLSKDGSADISITLKDIEKRRPIFIINDLRTGAISTPTIVEIEIENPIEAKYDEDLTKITGAWHYDTKDKKTTLKSEDNSAKYTIILAISLIFVLSILGIDLVVWHRSRKDTYQPYNIDSQTIQKGRNYIDVCRNKGFSDNQIKTAFTDNNWPEEVANSLLEIRG